MFTDEILTEPVFFVRTVQQTAMVAVRMRYLVRSRFSYRNKNINLQQRDMGVIMDTAF